MERIKETYIYKGYELKDIWTNMDECGAVAERLRRRSREQKGPSSIPRLGISVEVTS